MKRLVLALALALAACDGGGNVNDTSVVAVRIAPANPTVEVNATIAFVATAFQVNGEQRPVTEDVTWTTSAASILSIDADGLATGEAAGEAYVTATLGDLTSPAQKVVVNPGPTPTPTPVVANHVVISEVMYNPTITPETSEQYVEIYNPTGGNVALTNWVLSFNNTAGTPTFTFPAFTLNAGAYVVVAADTSKFANNPYPPVTNLQAWTGLVTDWTNGGGWILLRDNTGVRVDQMAWGTGYLGKPTTPNWCGTNNPIASTNGTSVSRKPVNTDTDTCVDWANSIAPNPGLPTP